LFIRENGIDGIEPKKIPLFIILSSLYGHLYHDFEKIQLKKVKNRPFFHRKILITPKIP